MSRRSRWLRQIEALDPVHDHTEIYRISAGYEFPWDYQRALELALFRTYCVPTISALLEATGEFRDRPQKRYDDTALLMAELAEHGYDSPRGKEALRVINRAHGQYVISNDDMRYVLSTFVYEPIEWISTFGWRPLSTHEQQAAFHFYRAVGVRMGIREIPAGFDEFWAFKREYEAATFRFSATNQRVGTYTLDLLKSWYPKPLSGAVDVAIRGLLDEPMLTAFGFRPAPPWIGTTARGALRTRAAVVRLLPPRRRSKLAQAGRNPTYPGYPAGYRPSDLGAGPPPPDLDPGFLTRPRSSSAQEY
ncbi:oxygenase MpaB family protein [Cryptosporangium minutisporangium]|uniref:oxygenase MpaB family protein n=1 Tax=Cryptosporangium minutisporangium TaxID=113569 RepID=UPI0031EADBE5